MPRRRTDLYSANIRSEKEFLRIAPIENKEPFHLRVILHQTRKHLVAKIADAVEFVFDKQTGIYSNFHSAKISLS